MNKRVIAGIIVPVVVLAALFIVDLPIHAQGEKAGPKPMVDTYELMDIFFEPAQEELKAAVQSEPEGRKGWRALYNSAYSIAELTNLVYIRNDQDYMGTEKWMEMTATSQKAAENIANAVKEQDFPTIKEQYMVLVESCNACHVEFLGEDEVVVEP